MRAPFQMGEFPAPVKYGYINVGVVEEGPATLVGRTVFCLYPHQTRYVVPAEAVHPLPDSVPPGRAILAANLETAVNGLWDSGARIGDRITVIGAGTLGCLASGLANGKPGLRNTSQRHSSFSSGVSSDHDRSVDSMSPPRAWSLRDV